MLDNLSVPVNYSAAQSYCINGAGAGNSGRLATFASCAHFTAATSSFPYNSRNIFIGLTNANGSIPRWDDPNAVCPPENLDQSDWYSCGSDICCYSCHFNPSPSGPYGVISSNWDWVSDGSMDTEMGVLCEFGINI